MSRSRRRALLLFTLAIALLWRTPVTESEWDLPLCENDSLFQLHRIEQTVAAYPRVLSVDPFSHHPEGFRVHWLAPHTLFYATIAKAFGLRADPRSLAFALAWIPPLLGLVAIALALSIARRLTGIAWAAPAAGLLCATAAILCRPFFYGMIDHHLFANLGVGVLFLAVRLRSPGLWAIGHALLFAMTPEGSLYATLFVGGLLLATVASHDDPREPEASRFTASTWWMAPASVALGVLALDHALQTEPLPLTSIRWFHFSALHVLWFVWLGSASAVAVRVFSPRRDRIDPRWLVPVLAMGAGVLWIAGPELSAAFERLLGGNRLRVDEESSVLAGGFRAAHGWVLLLCASGVFHAQELVRSLQRRDDPARIFSWTILLILLLLGLAEWRHLYVASGLLLVGLAVAACETEARLRRSELFSGRPRRFVPAIIISTAMLVGFVPGNVSDRALAHGNPCGSFEVVDDLAGWLRAHAPASENEESPAADRGVLAKWSIGHQLHVLGNQPVVVDPFNYRVEKRIVDIWKSESAEALHGALGERRVRYVVLADPVGDLATVWRETIDPAQGELAEPLTEGRIALRPELRRFALFRLYLSSGFSTEFATLRPRHLTRARHAFRAQAGDRGAGAEVAIAKGQIYEVVRGAIIRGLVPGGARNVEVGYTVVLGGKERLPVRFDVPVGDDGSFRFVTGLPAPVYEESFAVPEGFRLSANEQAITVPVSPAMVRDGITVNVAWTRP